MKEFGLNLSSEQKNLRKNFNLSFFIQKILLSLYHDNNRNNRTNIWNDIRRDNNGMFSVDNS
jgi:hypothetical protein